MTEVRVGHSKDGTEIATVDQGQVQGQLQIEIGLDALNVGNMIILQGTV